MFVKIFEARVVNREAGKDQKTQGSLLQRSSPASVSWFCLSTARTVGKSLGEGVVVGCGPRKNLLRLRAALFGFSLKKNSSDSSIMGRRLNHGLTTYGAANRENDAPLPLNSS